MFVALIVLGLVGTYSPALAQNWRPISHITEKEASLIEQTVAVLKISVDLNKVEYYQLDGDYVALRLPNEDRFIGPLSQNIGKHNIKSINEDNASYIDTQNKYSATENNKGEEQGDCELNKLNEMWGNNPDDISNEDLDKFNNLVDAALRLCDPEYLDTTVLGERGNTFKKYIDNRGFSTQKLMFFWEAYITSGKARTIDLPNLEEIQFAINQIRDLVLNNPKYNIKVYSATEAVIRIRDKETYNLLKSRKLTSY